MKTLRNNELKTHFPEVSTDLIPYANYQDTKSIKTGLLEPQAKINFASDFKMTDKELLDS